MNLNDTLSAGCLCTVAALPNRSIMCKCSGEIHLLIVLHNRKVVYCRVIQLFLFHGEEAEDHEEEDYHEGALPLDEEGL